MRTNHRNGHGDAKDHKVRVPVVGVGNCASSLVQGVHYYRNASPKGRSFGDVPLNVELKLEVVDSPNPAGIVIDAVRCAKLALDGGIGGALESPSSYFMKSPPVQYNDNDARRLVEEFIKGDKAGANGCERDHGRARRVTQTNTAAAARR